MMNSSLSDPNNHVPEISPDDGWGDAEAITGDEITPRPPSILPPRRIASEKSAATAEPAESGLRIDSHVVRMETTEVAPQRLEVQEIRADVVRLEQEVPSPPRMVSQFTFHERQVAPKEAIATRGEGREWGAITGRPKALRWVFGMGVAITLMLVTSLMVLPKINAKNAPRKEVPNEVMEVPLSGKDAEIVRLTDILLPLQPEAMRLFASYARATGPDEVKPFLRKGQAASEDLAKNWRTLASPKGWEPSNSSEWSVRPLDGTVYARLDGTMPDMSAFAAYYVLEDNRLLLDWKATAAFGTASFASLIQGSGDGREIRGEIRQAQFYNTVWPESDYLSFTLVSPNGEDTVWCYARRDSAAAAQIAPLFLKGPILREVEDSQKVTVRLARGPENAAPNQWLIAEMLHTDWLSAE